jgi:hypothetical protein
MTLYSVGLWSDEWKGIEWNAEGCDPIIFLEGLKNTMKRLRQDNRFLGRDLEMGQECYTYIFR